MSSSTGYIPETNKWPFLATFIIAVGLFTTSCYFIISNLKNAQDLNKIKQEFYKIWPITIAGSFALIAAIIIYYVEDPKKNLYIVLFIVCLALGLSYTALLLSMMSKVSN